MNEQKNNKKANEWYFGFFGLFALFALPGILEGEWGQAVWLVWVVWFIFFFRKPKTKNPDHEGSDIDSQNIQE